MGADYQQTLIATYTAQTAALQTETVDYLAALYAQTPDYREAAAEAFAEQAVPAVIGSQESMQALTEAYLSMLVADMSGQPLDVSVAAMDFAAGLRGVAPAEVYQRPFKQVWYSLSQGVPSEQARDEGAHRLAEIASTDLQLAKTHTAREVFADDDIGGIVVGYRRVLEGPYSCGLCVLASTQRYHSGELMPIHPQCDCGIAPIIGDQDPGQTIKDQAVIDLHTAVQDRFGTSASAGRGEIDYRKVLIAHEHGEIGPVLTRKADEWTGPGDLAG